MKTILSCVFVVAASVIPATAQSLAQLAKEAEIKANVPYWQMLREDPTITLQQYNAAVRALAKEELSEAVLRVPSIPSPAPVVPRYTPTIPYYTIPSVPTYRPRSGTTTDASSGNTYNWYRRTDGTTDVNGMNFYTGSLWHTTIKPDGSMNGYDKDFNPWTYDSRTKTYMNLGTGKMCVGEGYARTCF